mmetsp:Transcript_21192/g.47827  ORF Transcript_21192/g.47827 Transcript_21192/m.47827 type:complete len:94 (-) Transcript_21192:374-655(-)
MPIHHPFDKKTANFCIELARYWHWEKWEPNYPVASYILGLKLFVRSGTKYSIVLKMGSPGDLFYQAFHTNFAKNFRYKALYLMVSNWSLTRKE